MAQRSDTTTCTEHSKRLGELEKTVNGNLPTIARLDNEFFNHDGGDGLKTIVLKHIARVDQREASEREFHNTRDQEIKDALQKANRSVMAWLAFSTVMVSAMALLFGIFVYLEGHRQLKSGELKFGENQSQEYSTNHQPANAETHSTPRN